MALLLNLPITTLGIPAPTAYAVLRDIATEGKLEARVMFNIYFSQAQRDNGGTPIDYQQCMIPLTEFESAGAIHVMAYNYAKANMPYFADAIDG